MGRRDDARRIQFIELLGELEDFCQLLREVRHFIFCDRKSGESGDVPNFSFCDSSQRFHLQQFSIHRPLSYHFFIRQKRKSHLTNLDVFFENLGNVLVILTRFQKRLFGPSLNLIMLRKKHSFFEEDPYVNP